MFISGDGVPGVKALKSLDKYQGYMEGRRHVRSAPRLTSKTQQECTLMEGGPH